MSISDDNIGGLILLDISKEYRINKQSMAVREGTENINELVSVVLL